ncbi:hypothetical protein [Pseudorhodoferax sp.]|uniref:hypothetical protein n=1 Tax=Pseudorhodoferax sp. TaxID=1993553 RepID=UPI002DD694C0|nr:hypothetical protein [Pseudorhodoferax sp.]
MLPMQEGQQWMQQAHSTHHAMVQAIENGQGYRAQALGEEHVEIVRMNLDYALERPQLAAELIPGMKLVAARRRMPGDPAPRRSSRGCGVPGDGRAGTSTQPE